jgi:hypothetical protein
VAAIVAVVATVAVVRASDPTAVYARVDKVVAEPPDRPETIQIWGVFALAKANDRNDYLPASRGYLYFKLSSNQDAARREWSDLKQVAGTTQIVSFGSRYELHPRLRAPSEPPANPDPYTVSMGLTKVRGKTDYAPIRTLLDFGK